MIGTRDYYKELVEYAKSPEHKVMLDIINKLIEDKKKNIISTVMSSNIDDITDKLTEDKYFIKILNRMQSEINIAKTKRNGKED